VGQNGTEYRPTREERKLLEVLLNPIHRHKSVVDLCTTAEVDRKVYYRAFEKPDFEAYFKRESKRIADRSVAAVINAFVKQAVAGSHKHGVTILEMAGMLGGEDEDGAPPAPTRVEIVVQDARKGSE
jgi:hypothetical protein